MKIEHKIDENGRKKGCPMGHCCDDCNLYRPMYQTGGRGEITQVWDCQWNNLAVLMSESKDGVRGVQSAIESARNESVKRQDTLNNIVAAGSEQAQEKIDRAIEDQKRLS